MGNEDFINEEPVKVEIDGKVFLIKEFTGEEYDKISNDYITINKDGNLVLDISKRNKAWLGLAVVDAPYNGAEEKPFKELKIDEKQEILNKVKAKIRIPLINAINKLNSVSGDVAKNCKKQS